MLRLVFLVVGPEKSDVEADAGCLYFLLGCLLVHGFLLFVFMSSSTYQISSLPILTRKKIGGGSSWFCSATRKVRINST